MSTDFITGSNGAQNVGAIGAGAQAVGAMSGGITGMRNDQAQGKADLYNAGIANQNATAVGQQTALKSQQIAISNAQKMGTLRAAQGESNTGTGGTNALVDRQSETQGELDQMVNDYQGQMKRAQFANTAGLDVYNAKIQKRNSLDMAGAGAISATASLLNGYKRYINNGTPMQQNTNNWGAS